MESVSKFRSENRSVRRNLHSKNWSDKASEKILKVFILIRSNMLTDVKKITASVAAM
jgi:hypothetical protein